jgi:hypothetical protein
MAQGAEPVKNLEGPAKKIFGGELFRTFRKLFG